MTCINLASRPWCRFDVYQKSHRRYYADFLKSRTWRDCPVRFYIEPGYGDLVSMIESKLAWYFLSKETGQELPKKEDSWVGH